MFVTLSNRSYPFLCQWLSMKIRDSVFLIAANLSVFLLRNSIPKCVPLLLCPPIPWGSTTRVRAIEPQIRRENIIIARSSSRTIFVHMQQAAARYRLEEAAAENADWLPSLSIVLILLQLQCCATCLSVVLIDLLIAEQFTHFRHQ